MPNRISIEIPIEPQSPQERGYINGNRAAWAAMLQTCIQRLDYTSYEISAARLIVEREAAISALRSLCARHGDNDWSEHLHLADIIDKHLGAHLDQAENPDV